jgi:hypothetical protein
MGSKASVLRSARHLQSAAMNAHRQIGAAGPFGAKSRLA